MSLLSRLFGKAAASRPSAAPLKDLQHLRTDLQRLDRVNAAGLAPLARPFAALDRSPRDEAACLRAAWAVLALKSARVRLAWMG
jgi:hypothetical protein